MLSAPQRCNAERSDAQRNFSHRNSYLLFLQRHRCDALPCFSALPVIIFTLRTSPFRLCFQFSFRCNGLLYKTTRNLPRVTTQRCRHWRRGTGKKKVYTTTMETLLFFFLRVWGSMVYTLFSGPMVYTLFPCFPRKRVYTIAFFALWPRGRATDRKRRGATVVVYTLFSLAGWPSQTQTQTRSDAVH